MHKYIIQISYLYRYIQVYKYDVQAWRNMWCTYTMHRYIIQGSHLYRYCVQVLPTGMAYRYGVQVRHTGTLSYTLRVICSAMGSGTLVREKGCVSRDKIVCYQFHVS